MEELVEIALVDWARVPDKDLILVCAKARIRAATKPTRGGFTPVATTADVLAAFEDLTDEYNHQEYARKKREEERLIKSGTILEAPTPATLSPEAKEAFWDEFYKSAGIQRAK